jgi:aminoglycoside phosphotransferase (APT) family kinase protein
VSDWTAELVVDEALARRLLGQFPELEVSSLRPLASGWDYTIWVVDEEWAFRFPRREIVRRGTELEIAVVPLLAPLLPLPVPAARFVGEPTDEFPWPFFGSPLLPGVELTELDLDAEQRLAVALELASFLRALHTVELDVELPTDSNRRADMATRVPKAREQLAEVERHGIWRRPASVEALLDEAEQLPASTASAVVHGDLHVRQLLVEHGRLTGVLDWVDLCRTDPAIDLSMAWSYLDADGRRSFLHTYGPVTDEQLLRARVVALSLGAALALYGRFEGNAAVAREAIDGLDRAAA